MAPRQRSLCRNGTDETSSFVDESSGTGSGSGSASATSPLVISSSSSSSSLGSDKQQQQNQQKGEKGGGVRRPRDPPPTTLDQTEADIERMRHDYFNLVALALMIVAVGINYDVMDNFKYNGNYFWTMWGSVAAYFVADMIWVVRVPICVKSPHVIVKHHVAAMLYLVAPVAYPYLRWLMGVILSVEINTWFLICRRCVYKNNGSAKVAPALSYSVSAMFYITWIVIRCYLYPRYMVIFLQMWFERYQETGRVWHIEVIFLPVHAALCSLNLKWSYDLFTPIIKRWLGTGPKTMVVQNGL